MTRASSLSGIPQIVSTMSSVSFADLAAERDRLVKEEGRKNAPLWWQLYIKQDRKESERSIEIAATAGAEAIVITVDVASIGKREADAPRGKLSGGVAASGSKVFDGKFNIIPLYSLSSMAKYALEGKRDERRARCFEAPSSPASLHSQHELGRHRLGEEACSRCTHSRQGNQQRRGCHPRQEARCSRGLPLNARRELVARPARRA